MRTPVITSFDNEDLIVKERVENSGTRKNKDDIIFLFKKYIDSTSNICRGCNSEIIMMWKMFLHHFEIYKNNIK